MKVTNKIAIILICVICAGCLNLEKNIRWGDINLFKDTPAWELVCAVEFGSTKKIERILEENPELVYYKEPQWGLTPLHRAVGKRKYKSAETLLKSGANPNVRLNNGWPLIFDAISPEWGTNYGKKDLRMLELLLKYGADPNFNMEGDSTFNNGNPDISPLIFANRPLSKIDKTKLLVEHGADINYTTRHGANAATMALRYGLIENAHYLIVEKGADISKPYYHDKLETPGINFDQPFYPVDDLVELMYPLDSREYQLKKEIIQVFESKGINYSERKKELAYRMLDHIKHLYPDSWEDYLEKY
ncbi:MAG: hypothetical protein JFR38_05045 [Muribaculaceae bacterium]|nr:hypothetical protein [Muribaculaceae bacterium]